MGKINATRKCVESDKFAVSAVIGVILMVAITVAVAATMYVYISGMVREDTQSTPAVGMTASPVSGTGNCVITIAHTSSSQIAWATAVAGNLNCITNATKMPASCISLPSTGYVTGGDLITLRSLVANSKYTLTLTYKATGGTMGIVTWILI